MLSDFVSVQLATSFNFSYLNFIVGVCNELNDNWHCVIHNFSFLIVLRFWKLIVIRGKDCSSQEFIFGVQGTIHFHVTSFFLIQFQFYCIPNMYMHKDCKIEKQNQKNWLKTLTLIHIFILGIHLHFTSYKDNFKKVKIENHLK